jgi:hypothetical protein
MCETFKALAPEEKMKMIDECNICENCLLSNHQVDKCFRPSMCGINGCQEKHSRFIHSCKIRDRNSDDILVSAFSNMKSNVCIPIVKVKINHRYNGSVLLDTASTGTFCTTRLVDRLGIDGVPIEYVLSTLHGTGQVKQTKIIKSLIVESSDGTTVLNLQNIYVIDRIPIKNSRVNIEKY